MKPILTLGLIAALALPALAQTTSPTVMPRSYIELDGETQYLSVPAHPDFDIPLGRSYTISAWMYGQRTMIHGDAMRLVSRMDVGKTADSLNRSGYELMGLRTTSGNFVGLNLPDGAGKFASSANGWLPTPKPAYIYQWYHVALVIDRTAGTIRLLIDGQEVLNKADNIRAWSAVNALPLFIGAGQRDGKPQGLWAGRLDNLRFYHRALTDDEVAVDRTTSRISPETTGLVAAFDFDGYTPGDTSVVDATGRHTARLHGFAPQLSHERIKTFVERKTNAHLIGRANTQALKVIELGLSAPSQLESLTIETEEASATRDVLRYRLYLTDNGDRFDHRSPGLLLAEGKATASTTTLRRVRQAPSITAQSKLWLVADISPKATEGHKVTTRTTSIQLAGVKAFAPESQPTTHEIVLERTLLWTPGENGSASYRIPGIVRLDNGHLVAVIDHRKNTDYDLPSDIDVEVKISRDHGKTWSAPITVAKGTPEHGYGDAAMTTDGKNIYMVMVAGSGLWYYPSAASKPLEMFFTKSSDGGRTWAPVREITQQVYTDRYPNGGFFGSGNGIITSRGRIAFVAAMRTESKWGGQMDNVMVYSDDLGQTWQASPVARSNGDEAKIIELANGDLLISSRNRAWKETPRTYVLSSDHGMTWSEPQVWHDLMGNACNTALTRYSLEGKKGAKQNILLHTLIEAPRRYNLRIYLSEDEGKTWPVGNTLCTGEAAYSEVTPLGDGTIAIISEEDDRPAYDIYYTRVSLDWIRQGGKNPNSK